MFPTNLKTKFIKSRMNIILVLTGLINLFILTSAGCNSNQAALKENFTEIKNQNTNQMKESENPENPFYSRTDTSKLNVPDSEWKKILPEEVYEVAREKGTERAFTGKYWNTTGLGTYYCAVCGNKLFRSDEKFASACGWPSFFETSRKNSVTYHEDNSYGMNRTEVLCGRCDSHLGHLFDDGPPPTGKRYCMNSIVLDFVADSETGKKEK